MLQNWRIWCCEKKKEEEEKAEGGFLHMTVPGERVSLSLVPSCSSTAGSPSASLGWGFFFCNCWRKMLLEVFCFMRAVIMRLYQYRNFEILPFGKGTSTSTTGYLVSACFTNCISAVPFQGWLMYQQPGEGSSSPLSANPADSNWTQSQIKLFSPCTSPLGKCPTAPTIPMWKPCCLSVVLSALFVQPRSLKPRDGCKRWELSQNKQVESNLAFSFCCVNFKQW